MSLAPGHKAEPRSRRSRDDATSAPPGRRGDAVSRRRLREDSATPAQGSRGSPRAGRGSGRSRPRRGGRRSGSRRSGAASRDRPLHDLDRRVRQEGVDRRLEDPGDLGRVRRRVAAGDARDRDDRGDPVVADRDEEPRRAGRRRGRRGRPRVEPDLLRGLAQCGRGHVAFVPGSALPPGKLTSPLWWPSYVSRSVRTMRASPSASGKSRTRTAAGRAVPVGASRGRSRSSLKTGMSAAGPAGSGPAKRPGPVSRRTASSNSIGSVDELARVALRLVDVRQVEDGLAARRRAGSGRRGLPLRIGRPGVASPAGLGHDGRAIGREDERPADRVGVDADPVARLELAAERALARAGSRRGAGSSASAAGRRTPDPSPRGRSAGAPPASARASGPASRAAARGRPGAGRRSVRGARRSARGRR